jgi:hypothetical protein
MNFCFTHLSEQVTLRPNFAVDFGTIQACLMGGRGSGNSSWRRSRRDLVEHTLVLDMAALNQDRRLIPGTEMIGRWQATSPLRSRTMTITYDGNLTDLEKATLHITFWAKGMERRQTLCLAATQPRLGGVRLWFVCPVTGRRARSLYLPEGQVRFASREAHRLSYRSQGESDLFRRITRAQNIRARLGGNLSIYAPFPPRPRGMHRRTYERLRAEGLRIEVRVL